MMCNALPFSLSTLFICRVDLNISPGGDGFPDAAAFVSLGSLVAVMLKPSNFGLACYHKPLLTDTIAIKNVINTYSYFTYRFRK